MFLKLLVLISLYLILSGSKIYSYDEKEDIFKEENIYLLEFYANNENFVEFIEIYLYKGNEYIPIDYLIKLLHFPINIDHENHIIKGWFIKDKYNIYIDLNNHNFKLDKIWKKFNKNLIIDNGENIYIERRFLEEIFRCVIDINYKNLSVNFNFKEKLPYQSSIIREIDWKINSSQKSNDGFHQKIDSLPYQPISWPVIDLNLNYNIDLQTEKNIDYSYSVLTSHDLLYFNTSSFVTGNNKQFQDIRFTASKKSEDKKLIGILKASKLEFGDINTSSLSLINNIGTGRGVSISNSSLENNDKFDTTSFTGYGIPGWQASLSRNENILGFQKIDSDGVYKFINIPVIYGLNEFKIILYGPQGEIIEKQQNADTSSNILKKYKYIYNISVDQKNTPLFNSIIPKLKNQSIDKVKEIRKIGSLNYGLTDSITTNIGVISTYLSSEKHNYYSFGIKTSSFPNILISLDKAYDDYDKSNSYKSALFTRFMGLSIKASYIKLNNFRSEEFNFSSFYEKDYINNINEIDISRNLNLWNHFTMGLNLKRIVSSNDKKNDIITARFSGIFRGSNITNNLILNRYNFNNLTSVKGELSLSKTILETVIRLGFDYSPTEKSKIKTLYFSGQKKITGNNYLVVDLSKNLQKSKTSSISSSIVKDFKKYKASIISQIDNKKNYYIGLNLYSSIGREPVTKRIHIQSEPMASLGSISTSAFLDKNYNNIHDDDEEYIDQFNIHNFSHEYRDNSKTVKYITNIIPHSKNHIYFDNQSLQDPSLLASHQNYIVTSRPGINTNLKIPIISVSQIEGKLYMCENGEAKFLNNIKIDKINKYNNEIISKTTEFDGYYLYDMVTPGLYSINIPSFVNNNKYTKEYLSELKIDGNGEIYTKDIYLNYKDSI